MGRRNVFPPSGPEPSPSFRFFRTHSQNHKFCTTHVFRRKNKDTLAFLRQDSPPVPETFHPQPQCGWARSASFRTSAHTTLFFSVRTRTCSSMEKCCGLTPPPRDNSAGLIVHPPPPPPLPAPWGIGRIAGTILRNPFLISIPTKSPSQRCTKKGERTKGDKTTKPRHVAASHPAPWRRRG